MFGIVKPLRSLNSADMQYVEASWTAAGEQLQDDATDVVRFCYGLLVHSVKMN